MDLLTRQDRFFVAKIMGAIISMASVIVLLGWMSEIFNIYLYGGILPQRIGMKFTSALSFLLSGLLLLSIANAYEKNSTSSGTLHQVASMVIMLIVIIMLISSLEGTKAGIEHWFVGGAAYAIKGDMAGSISFGTMVAFVVISLVGIFTMINPPKASLLLLAGIIECAVGGLSFSGHLLNIPILYFGIEGATAGVGLPAAVLIFMMGMGLLVLGTTKGNPNG
ncbi:hypothetical protein [Mariprofundus aestuarium]|uniref:hypothetical protein n=1 Tax=Mariprofundus aestuarium TaxID=1921086 RepID=UPI000C21D197|nr:hypothetical protein [Mariprofundus aestuarium]